MDEMNKLIKEKGITGNQGEEIIFKSGVPAMSCTVTARACASQGDAGLTGRKIVVDTYGDWGGQVYCLHLQAALSVMKSE